MGHVLIAHTKSTNITAMKNAVSFVAPLLTVHVLTVHIRSTSMEAAGINAYIAVQHQQDHALIVLMGSMRNKREVQMPPKYSKEETIMALKEDMGEIDQLYKSKCINWKGQVGTESYSEIISAYLIENNIVEKMKIDSIKRENYSAENHDGKTRETHRQEENFAKELKGQQLDGLGKILDYQVPLKKERADKAGKIDLITLNEKSRTAFIVELKYGENKETLLRTVLEIATYFRQLNLHNFINSFEEYKGLNENSVKQAVLVWNGTQAYKEARELVKRPKLRELIKKLKVDLFIGSEQLAVECIE